MRRNLLILAPHPDDESIIGLLPLRLQEECGFRVWVVAATLGSRVARQAQRRKELQAACKELGFRLCKLKAGGDPVVALRELLVRTRPAAIFLPHAGDGHPTHRATHRLGVAAMDAAADREGFHVVETEYWHPLRKPNLMVAASRSQLGKLRRALACHQGEVARNDYAARLPAWMSDNVRRGAELVGGAGAVAPDIAHATLYRARRRIGGKWRPAFRGGRILTIPDALRRLVESWGAPT